MAEQASGQKKRFVLSEYMREITKGLMEPIAAFFNRLGLHPNTMTLLGLIGNTIGAYFLARGQMTIGGILILAMGPVDSLDGTMARLRGEPSPFGAFVDSVTDRYSELVIFLGLLIYYWQESNWLMAVLTYLAAAGSMLVSYVKARGQSVGYDTKAGLLSRFERYLVLVPALIFNYPPIGIAVIAFFANFTALQRILDIRKQANKEIFAARKLKKESDDPARSNQ